MKALLKAIALATLVSCFAVPSTVGAAGPIHFKTQLKGVNEVPPNATRGTGELTATISADRQSITYTLTYSNLEGTNPGIGGNRLLFAHFHLGLGRENGGVMVFLCDNKGLAPAGVPMCPDDGTGSGTVKNGTITSADVVGPAAQGILKEGAPGGATETAADAFGEVLRAIEEGASYTNVHTQTFPGGEIRGQNRGGKD